MTVKELKPQLGEILPVLLRPSSTNRGATDWDEGGNCRVEMDGVAMTGEGDLARYKLVGKWGWGSRAA